MWEAHRSCDDREGGWALAWLFQRHALHRHLKWQRSLLNSNKSETWMCKPFLNTRISAAPWVTAIKPRPGCFIYSSVLSANDVSGEGRRECETQTWLHPTTFQITGGGGGVEKEVLLWCWWVFFDFFLCKPRVRGAPVWKRQHEKNFRTVEEMEIKVR